MFWRDWALLLAHGCDAVMTRRAVPALLPHGGFASAMRLVMVVIAATA
jgi:hypothetical protein